MTPVTSEKEFRVLAGREEEQLVNIFFVLYKTSRIVEDNNQTFINQSEGFFKQLQEFFKENDSVAIKIIGDRYFVNDRLVRFNDTGISGAASIVAEWKTLEVGGVRFSSQLSLDELREFFKFVANVKPKSQNLESLSVSLKTHQLSNVRFLAIVEKDIDEPVIPERIRQQLRKNARKTFFQAVNVVEEVMVNTQQGREINIAKTKRVVHSLIDHITKDESSLIELSAIKDFDDYTYAHSTNVCVYALTLGVRLGMDRARLSQLGFTALFHDIGKVKLPADLIRKPDAFDENDWRQMQQHPALGAKTILRNLKLNAHTARAVRGSFEHHINIDFTGYPFLKHCKRPANLFSRIIAITDTFDALTSGRLYLKKAISPDKVLGKMHYQMKIKFDSFLLKLFNKVIGIYPSGSLVLLTSDEIAVILTNNEDNPGCPYVKIVGNRDGLLENPEWVDLSSDNQQHRKIECIIDPEQYGLNVKDFILGD